MGSLPSPAFWRNKKVLLTGHTGFIGGWLALWLQEWGAKVYGLALAPSTTPNLFSLLKLEKSLTHQIGDIRDQNIVNKVFQKTNPEIVLHLAAQPLVRQAYETPIETYATNVMGTAHICEAARQTGTKSLVVFTTDKVYDNKEQGRGFKESDSLGGREPYGTSKACAEHVAAAYRASYQIPLATLRAGNVIGGGDWSADRLIPDAMRAFAANQPLEVRNPASIRPWQHVLEPVLALLQLAENLYHEPQEFGCGFNIGPPPEEAMTVEQIGDALVKEWGQGAAWRQITGDGIYEAKLLHLDNALAGEKLGWRPVLSTMAAIAQTVAWYKAFYSRKDMLALSEQELYQFMEKSMPATSPKTAHA
ncbi:MAG: CDP-glucose 4,6-dehydratase [Dongiaceae bacterium]